MAKVGSTTLVAAITSTALAVLGVLAWQASAAPDHNGRPRVGTSSSAARHSGSPSASAAQATALPANSGLGKRVVYSLSRKRVWLVGTSGRVERTYAVAPGTVSPAPGVYYVNWRQDRETGTDGVPVENVVLFDTNSTPVIGFSAAVDGQLPAPDPSKRTGGIREHLADGDAMWQFALLGAEVVVVR